MARGVIVGVVMGVECPSAAAMAVAGSPGLGVSMEVEQPMGVGYPGAGVVMEVGYPMEEAYPGAGAATEAATAVTEAAVDKAKEAAATFMAVEVPAVFNVGSMVAAPPVSAAHMSIIRTKN